MPELNTVRDRELALDDLVRDVHAPSQRKVVEMKMRTITTAVGKWGVPLFPPSAVAIKALAATLKRGGYRSAESYLLLYRAECERRGTPYTSDLARIHRDCVRSCLRGLGGPVRALGLPFERLGELDLLDDGPWCQGGPIGPAAAVIAGAWFLTREVELSTTRAALVTLKGERHDDFCVEWRLPASKSDQQALGVARSHGCACGGAAPAGCPYHAVEAQLRRLRRWFPRRWTDSSCDMDLPLFPDSEGAPVTKEAMTATLVEAANRLKVPLSTPDGSARISGHTLRRTGAQGFARMGVDSWAIQLLGRWGSAAVLDYIQEVPLERSTLWARSAAAAWPAPAPVEGAPRLDGSVPLPRVAVDSLNGLVAVCPGSEAADEPQRESDKYIKSSGQIWHRVPCHGAVGPVASWTTTCGWRFGGSDGNFQDKLPQQLLHKYLCKRCLPAEHRAAKERCGP